MRFVLLALLALPTIATAQTRRLWASSVLIPEVQLEVPLAGSDYVLLRLNAFRYNEYSSGSKQLGFDQGLVGVGYEHFWNEHWSWGGTVTYGQALTSYYSSSNIFTPGLLLRHRSAIGPLTFGQRLGVEYALNPPVFAGSDRTPNRTLVRLRLDLEKFFPLGTSTADGLGLRPRLSFEPLAFVQLQKEDDTQQGRTIDFTVLRAELGCRVSPRLDFTPWFALSTNYYYTLPQFDAVTGKLIGGGNLNQRIPVVGLDVRLLLLTSGGDSADRRELPTQH